jgi:hypothetical protein
MTLSQEFDLRAFFDAVDAQRREQQLTWPALATALWKQSRALNEKRNDRPISAATIRRLAEGRGLSCQHARFVLRWLGVPPETFVPTPQPGTAGIPLPLADESHRLRWSLRRLYGALDAARAARDATWQQAADHLHCTPGQLTGLRTAKFATGMRLAMRITQVLRRPAADFVHVAEW